VLLARHRSIHEKEGSSLLCLQSQHRICHLKAFFFLKLVLFGGRSEACRVSAASVSCKEAANELPKVEMVGIPEVFLLF